MRRTRAVLLVMTTLVAAGCTATAQQKARRGGTRAAERLGVVGWFWVNPQAEPLEDPEAEEDEELLREQYDRRFAPVVLGPGTPPCDAVLESTAASAGPVYLLVHGIGGDNQEMEATVPILAGQGKASLFMYRWLPYDERDYLARQIAGGITRISECLANSPRPLFVVAHSAGGVLASFALGYVKLKPRKDGEPRLHLVTVASPLAGTGRNTRGIEFDDHVGPRFLLDLGGQLARYPRVPAHAEVLHLRTHESSDRVMVPSDDGHRPNDVKVGVLGARQVDLPHSLGHDEALIHAANKLVSGEWRTWRRTGVVVTLPEDAARAEPRPGEPAEPHTARP